MTFEWKPPVDKEGKPLSNAIERDRARTYFQAYAAAAALYFVEQALAEVRAGRTKTWESFKVPDESISCGFTEAVRGVLSHHMVMRGGKIANYHPYPPTPWNGSVRDSYGTPGPYEDAVQNTPIFEENPPEKLQGHRHHAGGAQLRPLPALRRAHVPGRRPGSQHGALADRRDAGDLTMNVGANAVPHSATKRSPTPGRAGARVEALLAELRARSGPEAAEAAEELVTCLVRLYGAGLEADHADHRRRRSACRPCSSPTRWWRACCSCTTCTRLTPAPGSAALSAAAVISASSSASTKRAWRLSGSVTAAAPPPRSSSRPSPTPPRKPTGVEFAPREATLLQIGRRPAGHNDNGANEHDRARHRFALPSGATAWPAPRPPLRPDTGRTSSGAICAASRLGAEHAHLVDLERRSIACACTACALLFTRPGGRYPTVPDRVLHDPRHPLTDAEWAELQIPVAIAFFFITRRSAASSRATRARPG